MKFQKRDIYFGKNLKHLRMSRDFNQGQLGEMIGVVSSAISNYETGRSTPELNVFLELVEIFGLSSDDFLYKDLSSETKVSKQGQSVENISYQSPLTKEEYDLLRKEVNELANMVKGYGKIIGEFKEDLFRIQNEVRKRKKNTNQPR